MSDSDLLHVAQVYAPRCDPAFDRKHADWPKAVVTYARARTKVRLDALPRLEGKTPRLWAVAWLTPAAYALLRATPNPADRQQLAFKVGCHARVEPDGRVIRASIAERASSASGTSVASDEWLAEAVRLGGHQLVAEVAEVVMRRHEIGDIPDDGGDDLIDPLDRYQGPPGLVLARSLA